LAVELSNKIKTKSNEASKFAKLRTDCHKWNFVVGHSPNGCKKNNKPWQFIKDR